MAYRALLFCTEEKIAATVTQVLGELDFSVVPCAEPFAAVKQLMADHFDAVVVDCDNEQNAALLFKSARGSTGNQNALAVAVVEGQAGVAKAFRLGANLVLTKPVNVEQAKGTLRVARGLLKKNELAKAASNAPAPPATPPRPAPAAKPAISLVPAPETQATVATPAVRPALDAAPKAMPAAAAQSTVPTARPLPSASTTGSAAAAAPARKAVEEPAVTPAAASAAADLFVQEEAVAPAEIEAEAASATSSAPHSFTFGGTNPEESPASSSGGIKKILLVLAVLLGAGYAAYYAWTSMHPAVTPPATKIRSTAPASTAQAATPVAAPVAKPAASVPTPDAVSDATANVETDAATENKPSAVKASATAATKSTGSSASKSTAVQPIVMARSSALKASKTSDIAAPSMIGMPTSVSSTVPLTTTPSLPKPVLETVRVSQGVSQGLLVKRVQPVYPASALKARLEGDVSLLATVSKAGDITAVSISSGQAILAQSAVSAVKQWKYKPYLLNGEPVEIQTDITVRFRLPH